MTTGPALAPPTPGDDPERYAIEAADWLTTLDPDDGAVPYPLLLTAQRLALIALDRQRRIIELSNRVAELEHDARAQREGRHPTFRYLIGGDHLDDGGRLLG